MRPPVATRSRSLRTCAGFLIGFPWRSTAPILCSARIDIVSGWVRRGSLLVYVASLTGRSKQSVRWWSAERHVHSRDALPVVQSRERVVGRDALHRLGELQRDRVPAARHAVGARRVVVVAAHSHVSERGVDRVAVPVDREARDAVEVPHGPTLLDPDPSGPGSVLGGPRHAVQAHGLAERGAALTQRTNPTPLRRGRGGGHGSWRTDRPSGRRQRACSGRVPPGQAGEESTRLTRRGARGSPPTRSDGDRRHWRRPRPRHRARARHAAVRRPHRRTGQGLLDSAPATRSARPTTCPHVRDDGADPRVIGDQGADLDGLRLAAAVHRARLHRDVGDGRRLVVRGGGGDVEGRGVARTRLPATSLTLTSTRGCVVFPRLVK